MYFSEVGNILLENAKKTKMLALFNTLGENEKDIVIAMTESLVEKSKDNITANMTTTPVVEKRHHAVRVN